MGLRVHVGVAVGVVYRSVSSLELAWEFLDLKGTV